MKGNITKHDRKLNFLRWIARIISSLAIAFFIFMIGGDISFNPESWTLVGGMVAGFAIVLMISVIIAWLNEGIGGAILLFCAIAFAIFIYITAGRNKIKASVLISSPFWISGVLFLITRHKNANS